MKSLFVVDIMGIIVANVATALGKSVHYQYGSIEEINQNLLELTTNGLQSIDKYPIVALITDFEQDKNTGETNVYCEANLRMIIFNITDNKYKSFDRTTHNFIPTLYPIYEELINQIEISPYVYSGFNGVTHTQTDRYYWGRSQETKNLLGDYIDAIELTNLKVKIKKSNCIN
jgi:hypothetical protein